MDKTSHFPEHIRLQVTIPWSTQNTERLDALTVCLTNTWIAGGLEAVLLGTAVKRTLGFYDPTPFERDLLYAHV